MLKGLVKRYLRNLKILLLLLLGLILVWVLIVIVGRIFVEPGYVPSSPGPVGPWQQLPATAPSPPTDADWYDWYFYQKESIPFTFKYPKNAVLWGREEGVIQISLWGPTQESDSELSDGLSLRFYLPRTFENKSLRGYVETVRDEYAAGGSFADVGKVEEITLNGLGGYTFSTKYLENQGARHIYLQSTHQLNVFVEIVDATLDPTNQGFEEIADQILSTFEFLN